MLARGHATTCVEFPRRRTTQSKLEALNSISLASTIAMAVGLAAALPQILRMLGSRSANGQSQLGWAMGLIANASMGYVNLFGFHAQLLAASNALSATLCIAAMFLIAQFAPRGASADTEPTLLVDFDAEALLGHHSMRIAPPAHHVLAELPTREFVALRAAVHEVDAFRADQARRADQLTWAA